MNFSTDFIIANIEFYRDCILIGLDTDFLDRNVQYELHWWIQKYNNQKKEFIIDKYTEYDSILKDVQDIRNIIKGNISTNSIQEILLSIGYLYIRESTKKIIIEMVINGNTDIFFTYV